MRRAHQTLKAICRSGVVLGVLFGMMHADSVLAYVGTGSAGSGQVAVTQGPLRVNQTTSLRPVGPGQGPQTLGGDFDNRNAGPVHVENLRASIAAVSKAPGAAAGRCDSSDFTLAHRTIAVGADVPQGRGTGGWHGATIAFRNKPGVDQNACMGATVKLRYTIA